MPPHTPRQIFRVLQTTLVIWAAAGAALAQAPAPPSKADTPVIDRDVTVMDKDGTARIMRVLPLPTTVSPEAQALLATGVSWAPSQNSPAGQKLVARARELYPVTIEDRTIAGVTVKVITPAGGVPAAKKNRVLINLHGGGMRTDSGSLLESIPIAALTKTEVVTVLYRLPKAPSTNLFPVPVDDVIAVYKAMLKTHKPSNIAIYGTSAGGSLTGQAAVRIRHDKLPQPAALGMFSSGGDQSQNTESGAMFAVPGLIGAQIPPPGPRRSDYLGDHDSRDPLASPIYADLKGFPPTLSMTATRDEAMTNTVNFNRALRRAGVNAELVVFDSLPHAFWYTVGIPESSEALEIQAKFLDQHLGRK